VKKTKPKTGLRLAPPPKPLCEIPLTEDEYAKVKDCDGALIVQTLRVADLEDAYNEDRITRESLTLVIKDKTADINLYVKRKLDLGDLVVRMHDKKDEIRKAVNDYRNLKAGYQTTVEEIAEAHGIDRKLYKFTATKMAFVPL